jgi:hypothetical protein
MKKNSLSILTFILGFVFFICNVFESNAQESIENNKKNYFWDKVQFGGGLGLGFGSGYSNVSIAPSGIYNFNEKVALGLGVQYSYVNQKDFYQSHIYGASIIALVNPIEYLQLSAELEELKINNTFDTTTGKVTDNFWNTALFVGAGYRTNNVTIGMRYNLLHKDRNNIYVDPFMPFIRIYF